MLDDASKHFISEAKERLKEKETVLKRAKDDIIEMFEQILKDETRVKKIDLSGRVKTEKSLKEKIIRKGALNICMSGNDYIDNLDDIIGIRLLCLLKKEEEILNGILFNIFNQLEEGYNIIPESNQNKPYLRIKLLDKPDIQQNGHSIYKMKCQWINEKEVINVELQIKSLAHMFWGEVEHMLFYKNYAYTVGNSFYKEIMDSISKMLDSIDYQLEIVQDQFSLVNDKQVSEIKQMIAQLMYREYQPEIYKLIGSEIDLRQVYETIVEIKFKRVFSKQEALNKATELINTLNGSASKINEDLFVVNDYDFFLSSSSYKKVSQEINSIMKKDIYWRTFLGIYKLFDTSGCNNNELYDDISTKLMSFYEPYRETFENREDEGADLLNELIGNFIIEFFIEYQKIDFFNPNVYQPKFMNILVEFITELEYSFIEVDKKLIASANKMDIQELLNCYLKIKFNYVIHAETSVSSMENLFRCLEKTNNIWMPNINIDRLRKVIELGKPIKTDLFEKLNEEVGDLNE